MSRFKADFSISSRLDKFFLTENFANYVTNCAIAPCCLSNHDYLNLFFDFEHLIPCGPWIRKFNNALLDEECFCEYVTCRITDLLSRKTLFDSVKTWDFFKESLRGDIITFAREKHK